MEVVESRRAAFPFYFILIWWTIPCACCWMEGRKRWASECWCDSTEWCVNVAPATADGVVPFFLFLMGRICWCRTHRGGCRGFVSYSSFDHQLQPTLRHGKYEIRNTTTKFNQKNSSDAIGRWIGEVIQVHHPTGTFSFFPRHPSPSIVGVQLVDRHSLPSFSSSSSSVSSSGLAYPSHQPTLDGTGNALPTFEHIYETFEILKVKEEKRNYFSRNAIRL